MKENLDQCLESFVTYIVGEPNSRKKEIPFLTKANLAKEKIISLALNGKLPTYKLRAMVYKFLLREIYIEKHFDFWVDQQIKAYTHYTELKKEVSIKSSTDISIPDSQTNDIKRIINLDLDRTFQENNLFHLDKVRNMLFNILTTYSLSKGKYKQGMNEILSTFFLAIYPYYSKQEKYSKMVISENFNDLKNEVLELYKSSTKIENFKQIYLFFHNEVFLESDLYFLFDTFMKKSLFTLYTEPSSLLGRFDEIVDKKLKIIDEYLYAHFERNEVNLGIPFERWIKCVFNREFPYEQTLIIWDAIIANDLIDESQQKETKLEFIDFICISMIENFRNELLLKEGDECLSLLLHYPEVDEIFDIIKLADDKRTIYNDFKTKLLQVHTSEPSIENEEKLIPDTNYDKDFNQNPYNKKSTSLSGFLSVATTEHNSKMIKKCSNEEKVYKINEYTDAVETLNNLYKKYFKSFSEVDQSSFKSSVEVLRSYIGGKGNKGN